MKISISYVLAVCLAATVALAGGAVAAGGSHSLPLDLAPGAGALSGPVQLSFQATTDQAAGIDVTVGAVPVVSDYALEPGEPQDVSVYLPAWSFALTSGAAQPIRISVHGSSQARIQVSSVATRPSPVPEKPSPGFSGLPAPSTPGMRVQDYEKIIFPWFETRQYARPELGWAADPAVRDTGPFVLQRNYGTHPAVRIYYSPQVVEWLQREQQGGDAGELPDGSMIVKEMFQAPSSIYREIDQNEYFAAHPDQREAMLAELLGSWAVMIKDSGGDSTDGWFWTGPGAQGGNTYQAWLSGNLALPYADFEAPDPNAPFDPTDLPGPPQPYEPGDPHVQFSGFGLGTCIRCHASSSRQNTFSSLANIEGEGLIFRVDNSWRAAGCNEYLHGIYTEVADFMERQIQAAGSDQEKASITAARAALLAQFNLPARQRPRMAGVTEASSEHRITPSEMQQCEPPASPPAAPVSPPPVNPDFVKSFAAFTHLNDQPTYREVANFSFPAEFADHVYPGPGIRKGGLDNPHQYLTSDNCYGCHGGLGSAPYGLTMFVRDGDGASTGYNVSEFGEWRWSPMGLAGRDPIFHAQLESELALLLQEQETAFGGNAEQVAATQQALIDTCLRCHGAMGLRQFGIDHPERSKNDGAKEPYPGFNPNLDRPILNPVFNPNLFYLADPYADGQPQLHDFGDEVLPPGIAQQTAAELQPWHRYGELAREGISCTICHRISPPDKAGSADWVAGVRQHLDGGPNDPTRYPAPGRDGVNQQGKPWIGPADGNVWSDTFFYFLANQTTGLFQRNQANELYGPFTDVIPEPMRNSLGITPKAAPPADPPITALPAADAGQAFTSDSAVCGTCHTINLPNVGAQEDEYPILTLLEPNQHFQSLPHSIEQATYLEWVNSDFGPGAEDQAGSSFQSCQECHMPNRFKTVDGSIDIDPLVSQIASIQDAEYPEAEHALPTPEIDVKHRADYRRHEHVGLNAFMVKMFEGFPEILGVDESDYETGAATGADLAVDNMRLSAIEGRVATLEIGRTVVADGKLTIPVTVANQTGHRFPSGVAFRRAFVELVVRDAAGQVIWSSGTTDRAGVILDRQGNRLPTEFLNQKASPSDKTAQYQPHHQVITRSDQVQIYEELTTKADYGFTNSFIHRVHHIKDNRLPPRGWVTARSFAGRNPELFPDLADQGNLLYELMQSTEPEGASVVGGTDPNGASYPRDADLLAEPNTGADRYRYEIPVADLAGQPASVEATLYSQSFMPSWFYERFALANFAKSKGFETPETDRLYYIASHLELEGTALADWKLKIASADARVD